MLRLSKHMIINGMPYELIKRSDTWAIFSVQGGRRYEVLKIYVLPRYYDRVWWQSFPERETVSGNGQFLRDGSKFFSSLEHAEAYFEKISSGSQIH